MTLNKNNFFQGLQLNGQTSNKNLQLEELRKKAVSDGLGENDLNVVVKYLVETKLASSQRSLLLGCLIPESKIPKDLMEKIIHWYFIERSTFSVTLQKQLMQWLTGIAYYELTDTTFFDKYYYSFLFLLKTTNLLAPLCRLLYVISKPDCARRWVVLRILEVHIANGSRSHTSSVLNLLKSYKPEVVPERVSITNFSCECFGIFEEGLKNSHSRNMLILEETTNAEKLKWNSWQMFNNKPSLPRLIPPPENLNLEVGNLHCKKIVSVVDIKTMASLEIDLLKIQYPAQVLSLLANQAGFHMLAFGDDTVKTRFSHTLYHTLCKVFLLEIYPYTEKEKIYFLKAIKSLHEYVNQSIPVVTTFLFNYLLIWDGDSYVDEILGLLEWMELQNEDDMQKYVFLPLRQIFISSETHVKHLIIRSMGRLIKNSLAMDKRENFCFQRGSEESNLVNAIGSICSFVGELIAYGLKGSSERNSRKILMSALDFYEATQAVEQAGDLPVIIVMPPFLVYKCLFSGSRVCVARICTLLNRLRVHSVERLYQLGVFEDFAGEVHQLNTYLLDYYRCLWNTLDFLRNRESFVFHEDIFGSMFAEFKENCGNMMSSILNVEHNATFWNPLSERGNALQELANSYPSIVQLKQLVESEMLK